MSRPRPEPKRRCPTARSPATDGKTPGFSVRTKSRLNSYLSQRDENKPKPSGRHPKLRKAMQEGAEAGQSPRKGWDHSSHQGLLLFLPDRPFRLGHVEIYFCICSNQALVQFNNCDERASAFGTLPRLFFALLGSAGVRRGQTLLSCFLSNQFTSDRTRLATRPVKDLTPSTLYCSSPSRAPSPLWVTVRKLAPHSPTSRLAFRVQQFDQAWLSTDGDRGPGSGGRPLPEQRGLPVRRAFDHHNAASEMRKRVPSFAIRTPW
jgi:hypothetical protein